MIRILPDRETLAQAAAEAFVAHAATAIRERGRFAVVLAGGQTPRPMYELLARPPLGERLPWEHIHLFWSDERCVPRDDPRSNRRMVEETLLAGGRPPAEAIHAVDGSRDPQEAAAAYAADLRAFGDGKLPAFDLVLLGMGADGHTASLFPGQPILAEREEPAAAVRSPGDDLWRVTLTLPVLCNAEAVMFLVEGRAKADALRRVLDGPDRDGLPAARIRPRRGEPLWLVDTMAAAGLQGMTGGDGASAAADG